MTSVCGWWWLKDSVVCGRLIICSLDISVDGEDSWESFRLQRVHPKGNQAWTFIGRTVVEAKAPIVFLPDAKNWLAGKDPAAGKDWEHKEKGAAEHEVVRWHHWLQETVENSGAWHAAGHEVAKSWACVSNWTTITLDGSWVWFW